MGEWHGPDYQDRLAQIVRELDPLGQVLSPTRFISAMQSSGLLVRADYYVPDGDELLGVMKTLQWSVHRAGIKCRWVMCRETLDALAAKWLNKQTPAPFEIQAFVAESSWSVSEPAMFTPEVLAVLERRLIDQGMLFGVPIRVDPAARAPLFEIDQDGTWERPIRVVGGR